MSIKNKKAEGLQDLQDTLIVHENIEKVYFTASGNHYFNQFELKNEKGNSKFYGYLGSDIIPDPKNPKRSKRINIPVQKAEIVETKTRDEILAIKVQKPVDETAELKKKIADLEAINAKLAESKK